MCLEVWRYGSTDGLRACHAQSFEVDPLGPVNQSWGQECNPSNPRTQETKAGGTVIQGRSFLQEEFKACLGYLEPCLIVRMRIVPIGTECLFPSW